MSGFASVAIMRFSKDLIAEYRKEMSVTYGVSVSEDEAQEQLRSLTRALFPAKREADAVPVALAPARDASEVGASITPTSGHRDKNL